MMIRFLIPGRFYGVLQGTTRLLTSGRRPVHEKIEALVFFDVQGRSSDRDGSMELSVALVSQGTAGLSDLNQRIRRSRL